MPVGTYDGWESALVFFTNESAKVSFRGGSNIGSFLSGSRRSVQGTVTIRNGSSFSTSLRLNYNNVTLEQGDFETTLAGVNFGYFFTPRIYLQANLQYNDDSEDLGSNIRLSFLDTAGTGLFIVYNDTEFLGDIDPLGFRSGPRQRQLVIKYTKLFNLTR